MLGKAEESDTAKKPIVKSRRASIAVGTKLQPMAQALKKVEGWLNRKEKKKNKVCDTKQRNT